MRSPKKYWVVRCLPSFWHVLFINGQQGGSQNNMALPKGMKMRLLWISPYLTMRLCFLVELWIHFTVALELISFKPLLKKLDSSCRNWPVKGKWELSYWLFSFIFPSNALLCILYRSLNCIKVQVTAVSFKSILYFCSIIFPCPKSMRWIHLFYAG